MDYLIEYFSSPDGTSIAAARGGCGPPLFVVPTMVATIENSFGTYAKAFDRHEIVTFDRRGTGLSDRDSLSTEPESYLQDAQTVVDGFGLDGFDVLGTLLGTIEAASLAERNGERVKHLVLRAPVMGLEDWAEIPAVSAALAAMERDWDFFTESFSQMVVGWGNPGAPRMASFIRTMTTRDSLQALLRAYVKLDLTDVYSGIRAASLVEHHPGYFFPDTYSRRIASLISDCRMAIFAGPGNEFVTDFSTARAFLMDEDPAAKPGPVVGFQTVLFTDLESSTELTQRLGDDAAQELLARHDAAARAAVARHGGREVKHTGDGIMATFGSAVAAVEAALQVQRDLTNQGIRARVGLNAGEPIAEGDDLFGTAVQLAARITGRAGSGQVLVSNVVRELCAGKRFDFESLGEPRLKGFGEPIAVFLVRDE